MSTLHFKLIDAIEDVSDASSGTSTIQHIMYHKRSDEQTPQYLTLFKVAPGAFFKGYLIYTGTLIKIDITYMVEQTLIHLVGHSYKSPACKFVQFTYNGSQMYFLMYSLKFMNEQKILKTQVIYIYIIFL